MKEKLVFNDVHCHLSVNFFYKNIENFLDEWKNYGLKYIVSMSMKYNEMLRSVELSQKFDAVIAGIGIHPWNAKKFISDELKEKIEALILENLPNIVLGEIGLDHHFIKEQEYYPFQKDTFSFFLFLSEKYSLPLNIHSKGAEREVLDLLESYSINPKRILMHWYSGPDDVLQRLNEKGAFFSINPSILTGSTHKKVLEKVDISQLLTESDGNVKYWINGKKIIGSPAIIPKSIEKIAELKHLSINEVSDNLLNNFHNYIQTKK